MLKKINKFARNILCLIGFNSISPFLILAGLIIIFEDGFPIFFIQERVGLDKVSFNIIKIRTLKKILQIPGLMNLKDSNILKMENG